MTGFFLSSQDAQVGCLCGSTAAGCWHALVALSCLPRGACWRTIGAQITGAPTSLSQPSPLPIVLCDDVQVDPVIRRKTLVGVYPCVMAESLPHVIP